MTPTTPIPPLPAMARHSAIAHAAYHDLLRALLDDRVGELRGGHALAIVGHDDLGAVLPR